jgi:hypothetical protein
LQPQARRQGTACGELSAELSDCVLELAHQPTEGLARVGVDRAGPLDDHPRSRLQPLELRAALDLVELLALPAQQDETGEVAAMRRQKPRLDALDPPVLLGCA